MAPKKNKSHAKKKSKKTDGKAWDWPWKEEEEEEWGADIIAKYGELTDLDRRLHGHLLLVEQGKMSQAIQGRWHIESAQLKIAEGRRAGTEPSLKSFQPPARDVIRVEAESEVDGGGQCENEASNGSKAPRLNATEGAGYDALKKEGNDLYIKDDHQGAIDKYGQAIKAFEKLNGDDPADSVLRQVLATLYGNRAQAALAIVRKAKSQPGGLPKELRKPTMLALADASQAVELDEANGKAWLRRGQALLWLSTLQQRAKEAVNCFERAKGCTLPASLQPELEQWLQYAKHVFDKETPMPAECALM